MLRLFYLIIGIIISYSNPTNAADCTINRAIFMNYRPLDASLDINRFNDLAIGDIIGETTFFVSASPDESKAMVSCTEFGTIKSKAERGPFNYRASNTTALGRVYMLSDSIGMRPIVTFRNFGHFTSSARCTLSNVLTSCPGWTRSATPLHLKTEFVKLANVDSPQTFTTNESDFRLTVQRSGTLLTNVQNSWGGDKITITPSYETPQLSFDNQIISLQGVAGSGSIVEHEIDFMSIYNPNAINMDSSLYTISFTANDIKNQTIGYLPNENGEEPNSVVLYSIEHMLSGEDVPLDGTPFPETITPQMGAYASKKIPLKIKANFGLAKPGAKRSHISVLISLK